MIDVGPATADEIVLAFVRAEIDSSRFGGRYRQFLARRLLSRTDLVDELDLKNALIAEPKLSSNPLFLYVVAISAIASKSNNAPVSERKRSVLVFST